MSATSAERPLLLDTSAAVALVLTDHTAHEETWAAVRGRALGLSGHACFETFSVLTRLPAPARVTAAAATRLLKANFPQTRHLSSDRSLSLLAELPDLGVAGGAVYDALVGACAVEHSLELLSRDRRALEIYRRLGVSVRLLD